MMKQRVLAFITLFVTAIDYSSFNGKLYSYLLDSLLWQYYLVCEQLIIRCSKLQNVFRIL